jgi:hypothetical protein
MNIETVRSGREGTDLKTWKTESTITMPISFLTQTVYAFPFWK